MRSNKVRQVWQDGGNAVGCFLMLDSFVGAEALAHAGYDFLFVDMQHGAIDTRSAIAMMTAISTTDCTPIVRVPSNEIGIINRALDHGAYGIVCPLVNSRAEAEQFIDAVRYPPEGSRSWGPVRAATYGGEDYTIEANRTLLTIAMIETREAYENREEILDTAGLDAILVGPNDLGFSFGNWPRSMPEDPAAVEAIREIAKAATARGVMPGIHCGDAAMAREMFIWGYRFASVGTDLGHMMVGAAQSLASLRD